MVDSFFNYGTNNNQDHISSPRYLNREGEDTFNFDFNPNPNDQFRFIHFNQDQLPPNPNLARDAPPDTGSNHSTYSTTHSSKHSPAYTPNVGDQYGDDDPYSKVPPIVRKGIRKFYEPILDNGTMYKYEDDPNEYRKARKRIQNRESATRVRNRKKNHVEILEDEITLLKQEKADLKVIVSKLMAENNMLKQQVTYLERNGHPTGPHGANRNVQNVPMSNRDEEGVLVDDPQDIAMHNQVGNYGYGRVAPQHKFKRHIALLGVFTLMLCVYGLLPRTDSGALTLFSKNNFFGNNPERDSIVVSTTNEADHSGLNIRNRKKKNFRGGFGHMDDPWNEPWGNRNQSPHNRGRRPPFGPEEEDNNYSYIITIIEITVLLAYLGYLLYVGLSFYKSQTSKKRQYDSHNEVVAI